MEATQLKPHKPGNQLSDPKQERLYPSLLSDRYYPLTQLRIHIEKIADRWLRPEHALTLIDLGCGSTPYRPILEPRLKNYLAVDFPGNPHAAYNFSQDGRAPLPDASAEIILSTQVIEHVTNPNLYLRECYRLLSPGGLLVLTTHGYWIYHPHPTDLWRWTGPGLRAMIQANGFHVESLRGIMGLAASALQLLQDALNAKLGALRMNLLSVPLSFAFQTLIRVADRAYSARERELEASIFVIIARKTESIIP